MLLKNGTVLFCKRSITRNSVSPWHWKKDLLQSGVKETKLFSNFSAGRSQTERLLLIKRILRLKCGLIIPNLVIWININDLHFAKDNDLSELGHRKLFKMNSTVSQLKPTLICKVCYRAWTPFAIVRFFKPGLTIHLPPKHNKTNIKADWMSSVTHALSYQIHSKLCPTSVSQTSTAFTFKADDKLNWSSSLALLGNFCFISFFIIK